MERGHFSDCAQHVQDKNDFNNAICRNLFRSRGIFHECILLGGHSRVYYTVV